MPGRVPRLGQFRIQAPGGRGVAEGARGQSGTVLQSAVPVAHVGELFFRRPQSVYRIDRARERVEFLYKCVGRGTRGLATLRPGDELNMVGPLGVGFHLDPAWRHIVVLGRGVGIATLGPISQLAKENGVGVTAILSARDKDFVMAGALFAEAGEVVSVLDTDGSSAVENVEKILENLIAQKRADAFFTCGANRLFQLMKRSARRAIFRAKWRWSR